MIAGTIPKRPGRAFSLLEVLLVLAIVVVLAAVAVPRFAGARVRCQSETAARRIAADLNFARRQARISSTSRTVTFTLAPSGYRIPGVKGLTDPSQDLTVSLADEPYRASLVSVDFGGATSVTFDGYGRPSSGGTVVVRAGPHRRSVRLDADSGKAQAQ